MAKRGFIELVLNPISRDYKDERLAQENDKGIFLTTVVMALAFLGDVLYKVLIEKQYIGSNLYGLAMFTIVILSIYILRLKVVKGDEYTEKDYLKKVTIVSAAVTTAIVLHLALNYYGVIKDASVTGDIFSLIAGGCIHYIYTSFKGITYINSSKKHEKQMTKILFANSILFAVFFLVMDFFNGNIENSMLSGDIMKLILGEIVVMTLIGFIIDLISMKFSNYRANKQIQ